ncbi:MAG: VIT1/CCC1 transporter family protein [Candidatus Micrarchaeaceae archaeon]
MLKYLFVIAYGMVSKEKYFRDLQATEALHAEVYKRLAASDKDIKSRKVLEKLYNVEKGHADLLQKLLSLNGYMAKRHTSRFSLFKIIMLRKLLGLAFSIKLMEYNKLLVNKKFMIALRMFKFTREERVLLGTFEKGERIEDVLSNLLVSFSTVLKNIRDIIFGMNDGLVEVLAAVAGIGAALRVPLLIFVAGSLVAISGALSMAGGAYLSTKYEKAINAKEVKVVSPARSAFYVGLFYIFGAIFPILPFAFGLGGILGITAAIILTAFILSFSSSLIAIVSDESIAKRVAESLLISLGAAAVTIAIGSYARYVLHIIV